MKFLQKIFSSQSSENSSSEEEEREERAENEGPTPHLQYAAQECAFPFAVGAISDRGTSRPDNEDCIFHLQAVMTTEEKSLPFGIFILADGLGGHEDGQIASRLAVRAVAAHLVKTVYLPTLTGHGQDAENEPLNESLTKAIEIANRIVRENTDGGGSTLTALLLLDRTAYVAHVGDSRAYIISAGSASQITEDHSLGRRLMELQGLSEEDIIHLPERHTLYKALGQPTPPDPDISYHHIAPGSHVLLCSDGLWGVLTQQELIEAFQRNYTPREICLQLFDLAISRGSDDNVSLIALSSQG